MENYSELLIRKAQRYRWVFALCPFLKEVSIINSVAENRATQRSDIDLLIVTEKNRVPQVRMFLAVVLHFLGMRVHNNHVAGRFCLSFLVDIDHANLLLLNKSEAHFYRQLLSTRVYLYTYSSKKLLRSIRLVTRFLCINWISTLLQKREIRRALRGEFTNPSIVISKSVFKFHESDSRDPPTVTA